MRLLMILAGLFDHPPWHAQVSLQARRHESETVMFTCIKDLLFSCKLHPSEVRRICDFHACCLARGNPREPVPGCILLGSLPATRPVHSQGLTACRPFVRALTLGWDCRLTSWW